MGNSAVGSPIMVQRIQTGRKSFHPHHFRYPVTTAFPLAVRQSVIYERFVADWYHLPIRDYDRRIWNSWLNQPKIGHSSISPHDVTIKTMPLCTLWNKKGIAIPVKVWTGPKGSGRSRLPLFSDSWHKKVARLPAIRTGRLYLPGDIPRTHFILRNSSFTTIDRGLPEGRGVTPTVPRIHTASSHVLLHRLTLGFCC